jgi:hypothetical protein
VTYLKVTVREEPYFVTVERRLYHRIDQIESKTISKMTRGLRITYEHEDTHRSSLTIRDDPDSLEEVWKAKADVGDALDLCKNIEPDAVLEREL